MTVLEQILTYPVDLKLMDQLKYLLFDLPVFTFLVARSIREILDFVRSA